MILLKLTISNGPDKGSHVYINKDKICGFISIISRLGDNYGQSKGSNVLLDNQPSISVEESVDDICKMLQEIGYLQITSIPKKND
jgi:hypothetical protein